MWDTSIDHGQNRVVSLFHVVENCLGNVNKLKHYSLFVFPHELGELNLEVGLVFCFIGFLRKVEHHIVKLVGLELINHFTNAVLLIMRDLFFKMFTHLRSCLISLVDLKQLRLNYLWDSLRFLRALSLVMFLCWKDLLDESLKPLQPRWNFFFSGVINLLCKPVDNFLWKCREEPLIDKLWPKVLHYYDWLLKVSQNLYQLVLHVMDLLWLVYQLI